MDVCVFVCLSWSCFPWLVQTAFHGGRHACACRDALLFMFVLLLFPLVLSMNVCALKNKCVGVHASMFVSGFVWMCIVCTHLCACIYIQT